MIKMFYGKIISIKKTHLIIKNDEDQRALLHISEVSDYYIKDIKSIFKIGDYHTFKIISTSGEIIRVSWKDLNPRYLKNPFKFELKESGSGIKKLHEVVKRELDND